MDFTKYDHLSDEEMFAQLGTLSPARIERLLDAGKKLQEEKQSIISDITEALEDIDDSLRSVSSAMDCLAVIRNGLKGK